MSKIAKYCIWRDDSPVRTGCTNDKQLISDWVYETIERITGDSDHAVEASSWVEMASLGDEYKLDDLGLRITVSEWDY